MKKTFGKVIFAVILAIMAGALSACGASVTFTDGSSSRAEFAAKTSKIFADGNLGADEGFALNYSINPGFNDVDSQFYSGMFFEKGGVKYSLNLYCPNKEETDIIFQVGAYPNFIYFRRPLKLRGTGKTNVAFKIAYVAEEEAFYVSIGKGFKEKFDAASEAVVSRESGGGPAAQYSVADIFSRGERAVGLATNNAEFTYFTKVSFKRGDDAAKAAKTKAGF